MQQYFAAFGGDLPPAGLYDRVLAEVENPLVLACLTATRGNQIRAAELLGPEPQHAAQKNPRTRHFRVPDWPLLKGSLKRSMSRIFTNCQNS